MNPEFGNRLDNLFRLARLRGAGQRLTVYAFTTDDWRAEILREFRAEGEVKSWQSVEHGKGTTPAEAVADLYSKFTEYVRRDLSELREKLAAREAEVVAIFGGEP